MLPIARSPCLGGPDRVTPEPIIVVTLSEDVIDISRAHPAHDLLKEVSFQTTREQQEYTSLDGTGIGGIRVDPTPRMASIVTTGDFSLIVGSDVDGTRTNRVTLGARGDVLTRYIASTLQVLGLKN